MKKIIILALLAVATQVNATSCYSDSYGNTSCSNGLSAYSDDYGNTTYSDGTSSYSDGYVRINMKEIG